MDELQTGVEFSLAVLPQSPAFLQPGKGALNLLALGYDLEGVPFAALGDRYARPEQRLHRLGKRVPPSCYQPTPVPASP